MGKQTAAEFVENEEVVTCLRQISVDFAQGYVFGKPEPRPAIQFTPMLLTGTSSS